MKKKRSSICKFMGKKGFHQHVTQKTTEKGTLIDHVYVKTTQFDVECAVMPTYVGDHEGILCSLSVKDDQEEVEDIERLFAVDDDFEDVEGLSDEELDFDQD